MRTILWKLQPVQFKHFIKIGRMSVSYTPLKCFSNSLHGSNNVDEWDSFKKSDFLKGNLRSFNTSVKNFEKLAEQATSVKDKQNICIIYNGSLTHRIKGVKVFTIMTSIGGIVLQPWMLQSIVNGNDMPLGVALLSCVGFFTFVTPFLCHLITKKYVTEIWYNSATDTYTATVLSFFLRRININFKIEDVRVPSIPPMFSTMYIKGRPVFIIVDSFLEVDHYIKMMRYDKPVDLKLNEITDPLDKPQEKTKSKVL